MSEVVEISKSLKQYGAVIVRRERYNEVIKILRERGVLHMLKVEPLGNYVVIRIPKEDCYKLCNGRCNDVATGRLSIECCSEVVHKCVEEKISEAVQKLLSI